MKAITPIIIMTLLLIGCKNTNKETQFDAATELNNTESLIKAAKWEEARISALKVEQNQKSLSAIQDARLAVAFINLASEPNLTFEQYHNYAVKITTLIDRAMTKDSIETINYFRATGCESAVTEAYESCKYIIQAKSEIGTDSTYTDVTP